MFLFFALEMAMIKCAHIMLMSKTNAELANDIVVITIA